MCSYSLIKNTPGVKRNSQELKQSYWKRCEIKWVANASWFWCKTLLFQVLKASWCCWDDKDDRATKHQGKRTMFCGLHGHLYQKFWSHRHQEALQLSTWNNIVLQWVHHDQRVIFLPERQFRQWVLAHIFVASQLKSSIKPDIQKQAP